MSLAVLALTGCGENGGDRAPGETAPQREKSTGQAPRPSAAQRVEPARCPADAGNCAETTGRILYVERVDPDGDGDAHFVLLASPGITAPGITVVDVRADLRPVPLPGLGQELSAAGPVYEGSYGQRQIQADALNVGPVNGR